MPLVSTPQEASDLTAKSPNGSLPILEIREVLRPNLAVIEAEFVMEPPIEAINLGWLLLLDLSRIKSIEVPPKNNMSIGMFPLIITEECVMDNKQVRPG